jgi:hypothetical protein
MVETSRIRTHCFVRDPQVRDHLLEHIRAATD